MKEEWKQYREFDLLVSNLGNVKRLNGRILKPTTQMGRKVVAVYQTNGKRTNVLIAKAVCELFKDEKELGRYVHYIDNDLRNCEVSNLYTSNTTPKKDAEFNKIRNSKRLGDKLKEFDESDETVKDFNKIFNYKLDYHENQKVNIGSMITDSIRNILIDDDVLMLDLDK